MVEFETITVKVRKETADRIRSIKADTGMEDGEIIERFVMKVSPTDSEIAPYVALQELAIVFSELKDDEASKAMIETAIMLLCSMPISKNTVNAMFEKAIERQKALLDRIVITDEDEKEILEIINNL